MATNRPMAADDFMQVQLVSDPQVSPDGARVVFVKRSIDRAKNKYRSSIWMVGMADGEPRAFTGPESNDNSPRWSPDGSRIAFLSDRKKPVNQIFVISFDGGEAAPLTHLETEGAIGAIRWSPDGSRIAFLFRETPENERKEAVEARKKDEMPSPPRVHTRLGYRMDGAGYHDGSRWQVWVADGATGDAHALTSGDYDCGPPIWSPDGGTLAFLSDRRDDGDIASPQDDIFTIAIEAGESTRIASPPGDKGALAWSPDGEWLAYAGNPNTDDHWGTTNTRLFLLPATGSDTAQDLTGHTDLSLGFLTLSDVNDAGAGDLLRWSPDGQSILCAISSFGDTRLYRVSVEDGAINPLTPETSEMGGFGASADGKAVAITLGRPTAPHEIFAGSLMGPSLEIERRTRFNEEWLKDIAVARPEQLDSKSLFGWLIKPPAFEASRKYPLVLYVHGGPHLQYGNTLFHELQFLAAQGYVVLYCNPPGSKGYGEAHTQAINQNWGGPDFDDLMAAVDRVIEQGYIDPAHLAIMGGSYGGYMTAWAIGHTDRFRCAIADRLVANVVSMSGTCDVSWRPNINFSGNAWDEPEGLWRQSPQAFAGKINTPLLLIHSDGDLRCPIGQAEELFAALRLQRKTVEFVRYPAETSHGLSRNGPPNLRLDRLQRNLEWLRRWLGG